MEVVKAFCAARDLKLKTYITMAILHCALDPQFDLMVYRREITLRRKRLAKRTVYRHRHLL